jgi:hypothetical protein
VPAGAEPRAERASRRRPSRLRPHQLAVARTKVPLGPDVGPD